MRYTFDSREIKPGMGFVALKGEKVDGRDFIPMALEKGAADVISGLEELQSRAREKRRGLQATVVGVTGSAGKTTTKELLKAFLAQLGPTYGTEGNFNNHIGLPLTILNCPDDAAYLVLEMGSNHPGEIAALCEIAEPDIGVLTGVGTAHLEFFGTRAGIAAEKGELLASARRFSVYPAEDDFASALQSRAATAEAVPPSAAHSILKAEGGYPPHFAENASLAYAVASKLGLTPEQGVAALEGFALPGARWRRCVRGGCEFIDDTYNANPSSMIAALETLAKMPCKGRRVAILGDMFELGADSPALHRQVFERAQTLGLDLVIGVGELSSRGPCTKAFADVAALKKDLPSLVAPGDLVLLKASHSMALGSVLDDGW